MNTKITHRRNLLQDPALFSHGLGGMRLRPYQAEAVRAVVDSIRRGLGLTFVWIFPRQSGKDEALAALVEYLLFLCARAGGEMVFFNPTFKPQTETSMRRLEKRLNLNPLTRPLWRRRFGYIFKLGRAHCTYMSLDPSAHVVSATANLLLIVNEAQEVAPAKFDRDAAPMTASTHATRLFSGTRWTVNTLLEREYRAALFAEKRDGRRRVFLLTANEVRQMVRAYGGHVDEQVRRLGRQHPLVKTQYFCETVEAETGMFPPGRQALMAGTHTMRTEPEAGKTHAFLIDVAGQEECANWDLEMETDTTRDSTALLIVEIDPVSVEALGKPTYRAIMRREWTGERHVVVFGALRALIETWQPMKVIVDATGVGEGLWSLLETHFGSRVMPVKFTAPLKSALGYGFIGMIESGRYREYAPFDGTMRSQLNACRSEILPGPGRLMRWGVPPGKRDETGRTVHDDMLICASFCTLLDDLDWQPGRPTTILPGADPLQGMEKNY